MIGLLPAVTIIVVVTVIVLFILLLIRASRQKGENGKKLRSKDRNLIIRDANRKLAQNPNDPEALWDLAGLYYNEGAWEKAAKTYHMLLDMCATNPDLDEYTITVRYGLASMKLKQFEEAYRSLMIARTMKQDVFEINYNLGFLEYKRKNFEKAAGLLRHAQASQPEHTETLRYLGHSLFKIKKYKESLGFLKKVLDIEPEDKETLFAMGQCYFETGFHDQATRIFSHLRADPIMGPHAALFSGTVHLKSRKFDKAIMDLEIGLRHENIRPEIQVELEYRLAAAYMKNQEISKALPHLKNIYKIDPGYKDVAAQISKYQELNDNKNLQIYLIAPPSDFVALCRKIAVSFFPKSRVKITDISVYKTEYADIMAEVETVKWQDTVLFRFMRATGQVGELVLRDFHAKIKDMKVGRGFCLSAGKFSDGAIRFVEARLIDLIGKDELMGALQKVDELVK